MSAAAAPSDPAPAVSANRGVVLPPATRMRAADRRPDAGQPWVVARIWNEQLLGAIRGDTPRPTVQARNLFHLSAAMYDAWAIYGPRAGGVLHHEKLVSADSDNDDVQGHSAAAVGNRVTPGVISHGLVDGVAKSGEPGTIFKAVTLRAHSLARNENF